MKLRSLLAVLACSFVAIVPASAAVLFKGLSYTPTGVALADLDGDGRLDITNIGSSGQDGFTVDCPNAQGMELALDGVARSTDPRSSQTFTYSWSLASKPGSRKDVYIQVLNEQSSLVVSSDLSAGLPPVQQTLTLRKSGSIVYLATIDNDSPVSIAMDATGSCPLPALTSSVDRRLLQAICDATWSSPVQVSVGGQTLDCDDMTFSRALAGGETDVDCGGATCAYRATCLSSGQSCQFACSSGYCRVLDQLVQGSGQAQLDLASLVSSSSSAPRMPLRNLGSSGEDGVDMKADKVAGATAGGSAMDIRFAPPSLVIDPAVDNGASVSLTLSGTYFSPGGTSSPASPSLRLTIVGNNFYMSSDHSSVGADAESVAVLNDGVEVGRCAIPSGSQVQLSSPSGGSPVLAIASLGRGHTKSGHVTLIKGPQSIANSAPRAGLEDTVVDASDEEVTFRANRAVLVAGRLYTGNQLVFWGGCSSGTCGGSFQCETTHLRVRPAGSQSTLSDASLLAPSRTTADQVYADVPGTVAITPATTCVAIPCTFSRTDATPARAYSVTFHLSSELATCGARVVEGDYLSQVSDTQMFVTDHGGGSYTVDCGILGAVCGATGSGTLFTVDLTAPAPVASDVGVITIDAVTVRDCSNHGVPASAGGDAFVPIDFSPPSALSALSAAQVRSGNGGGGSGGSGGTTAITVSWPGTEAGSTVALYRAPFGNYPLYDNGSSPGHVPAPPPSSASAVAFGWTPLGRFGGGQTCQPSPCLVQQVDHPGDRDFYYYVAFVTDLFGNESPVSNMTAGTLDYHLGDVSDGSASCSGDDLVSLADLSALGAYYGLAVPPGASWSCLDVGPTTDYSVDGRPTTDGMIQFEDFMMFAINYGVVSRPQAASRPVVMAANAASLSVPATLPGVGGTFEAGVEVDGAGNVQGMSVKLAYDHDRIEAVGVAAGELLERQDRQGMVLSSEPGDVDAALLGTGPGLAGQGELARVTFRVKAVGDPALAIASATARDASNEPVSVSGVPLTGGPGRTAIGFAYPNPFRSSVAFQLSLHSAGRASVSIYDVAGRRVRMLVSGSQPAGARIVTWDGRDDSGLQLAPGAYVVRLEAGSIRETRAVRLVR
jgi:hypothetical protein